MSDSAEPVLALQGIGFFIRKGIAMATVELEVNAYEAPPKPPNTAADTIVTHIDIVQTAAGLSSTHEQRCVDDTFREHSDWLFGKVRGKTRWVSLDEITDEWLKKDWELEGEGGSAGKNFVNSYVESVDNSWVAEQVWGFQKIDGQRMYCRNVVVTKGSERVAIKLVYDYNGTQ